MLEERCLPSVQAVPAFDWSEIANVSRLVEWEAETALAINPQDTKNVVALSMTAPDKEAAKLVPAGLQAAYTNDGTTWNKRPMANGRVAVSEHGREGTAK